MRQQIFQTTGQILVGDPPFLKPMPDFLGIFPRTMHPDFANGQLFEHHFQPRRVVGIGVRVYQVVNMRRPVVFLDVIDDFLPRLLRPAVNDHHLIDASPSVSKNNGISTLVAAANR